MSHRWYDESLDDQRSRADEGPATERFRAGSRWDHARRDYERAPGRAHDDYGRDGYGRDGYGHQDHGGAYGFARHTRSYEDDARYRREDMRREGEARAGYSADRGDAGHGGYRGLGPKDYKRSDDRIREDVCDRLTDADTVDARAISVAVANGEVTLTGSVTSRRMKRDAEDAIEQCPGVQDIQNNLRIRQEGNEVARGDIAHADAARLSGNSV